jgi:tetratricopeptide (TPR) repeat protein
VDLLRVSLAAARCGYQEPNPDAVPALARSALELLQQPPQAQIPPTAVLAYRVELAAALFALSCEDEASQLAEQLATDIGLTAELSGVSGFRTTHQTTSRAQLLLHVTVQADRAAGLPVALPHDAPARSQDVVDAELVPAPEDPDTPQLSAVEQAVVLLLASAFAARNPPWTSDPLVRSQLQPFFDFVISQRVCSPFGPVSAALATRTAMERADTRLRDRAGLQAKACVDAIIRPAPDAKFMPRLESFFSAGHPVPPLHSLEAAVAELAIANGDFATALDIFEQQGSVVESIETMLLLDSSEAGKQKALSAVLSRLMKDPKNASLTCLAGELSANATLLEKAWELSDKKLARARRSSAKIHFAARNFKLAAAHFTDSLRVAPTSVAWLALGQCRDQLGETKFALDAYKQAAALLLASHGQLDAADSGVGDALANAARCQLTLGNPAEALTTAREALKYKRESWRLWHLAMYAAGMAGKHQDSAFFFGELVSRVPKAEFPAFISAEMRPIRNIVAGCVKEGHLSAKAAEAALGKAVGIIESQKLPATVVQSVLSLRAHAAAATQDADVAFAAADRWCRASLTLAEAGAVDSAAAAGDATCLLVRVSPPAEDAAAEQLEHVSTLVARYKALESADEPHLDQLAALGF